MIYVILATLFAGLVGIFIFVYFFNQGQFEDLEDTKYQVFRNDEEKIKEKGDAKI